MRNWFWRAVAAGVLSAGMGTVCHAAAPPVVPGYQRLKEEAKAPPATQGELLLGELNCIACHKAEGQQRILEKGGPDLSDVGARVTPQYLKAWLSNPHAVKPGTTMPDIFHASEAGPKQGAVEFLTHFLVSQGGPIAANSEEGNALLVDQGRALYHSIGCIACHAPEKDGKTVQTTVPSIPLNNLAEKTTLERLTDFLMDPLKSRPSSRMPSLNLERAEARAIAIYLLRDQLENPQAKNAPPARTKGLKYAYYEEHSPSCKLEVLHKFKPKSEGKAAQADLSMPHRGDYFDLEFTGAIHIPRDGSYTFRTMSDDGSCLYLDEKLLVDNDGEHGGVEKSATLDLKAGDHPFAVTFSQLAGGSELKVEWEGPEIKRQVIPGDVLFHVGGRPMVPLHNEPFTVDPQKAQMGRQMFAVLGCASCHVIKDIQPMRPAKALAMLNGGADQGCLGEHVAKGLPQYQLSADQRDALRAALKNVSNLKEPLKPDEQVLRTLAAMNCVGCHKRGDVGGPTPDRNDYFVMSAPFDMGDEGRIPPKLTGAGNKLKPEAMQQIIFENKLHIRPVLATRMPQFSGERIGGVVDAFQKADSRGPAPEPAFNEIAAKDGRTLVGTKGLGCVNCHGMGAIKSLGMPAPELSTTHDRLKAPWFHQLLHDPNSVNPGTRMPQFWPNGDVAFKALAGGTENKQQDAIWNYLSLGKSMALPSGLAPTGGYELVPSDEPIVHRTFMADVGNRSVLVGYPEMVHVAFDADVVRLAKAWRGKFFDARGMWEGRGGSHLGPLGTDVINLPPGPSFALLASPDANWPQVQGNQRNVGGHFKGYELDKEERPIFHYVLDGTIDIREQPVPVLKATGADLTRRFQVASKAAVPNLYFLAAAGAKIESKSPGVWAVDDKLTVKLPEKVAAKVRDAEGKKQLIVPVPLNNDAASFDVEMSW